MAAVEVDRIVRFGAPTRCALEMHLLHATWVKLHAKNRQRRLTEPELTWLLTLTNPTHHR